MPDIGVQFDDCGGVVLSFEPGSSICSKTVGLFNSRYCFYDSILANTLRSNYVIIIDAAQILFYLYFMYMLE